MSEKIKAFLKKYSVFIIIVLLIAAIITVTILVTNYNAKYNYYELVQTKYTKPEDSFSNVFTTTNNGYPSSGEDVDRLTSVLPSFEQQQFLDLQYFAMFNYGMHTLNGKQTSSGTEDPKSFNPTKIDMRQWFETLKSAKVNVAILKAKDDDGFCLWQTDTTEHSIKNASYMSGSADLVREFRLFTESYNMQLGLYYSLYDKNATSYGTDAYNDYVVEQLTELTNKDVYDAVSYIFIDDIYGPNVDSSFTYDYERYINALREGPQLTMAIGFRNYVSDVVLIGDSVSDLADNIWNVVDQTNPDPRKGTREDLSQSSNLTFIAPQLSVNLRSKPYYDAYDKPKSLDSLTQLYFKSVGYNTSFMLVLQPNSSGVLDDADVKRLEEFGEIISRSKKTMVTPTKLRTVTASSSMENPDMLTLTTDSTNSFVFPESVSILEFEFSVKTSFGRIDLRENLENKTPVVEKYEIWVYNDGWKLIADRGNIGYQSVIMLKKTPKTFRARIVIKQARGVPDLRCVLFYEK
ncbi:MAG: alpha-L-fucosidase [Christensenellaceae bacterium]|jgi:alpha-L-fucosidase|nr:alpha-L-fucosidase [Christensenellaceae bacterium]